MILINKAHAHYKEILELLSPTYEEHEHYIVGEDSYSLLSNEIVILEEDEISFEQRMSPSSYFLSDEDKEYIFSSKPFQRLVAEVTDKWYQFDTHDYLMHIADIESEEFEDSITYCILNFIAINGEYGSGNIVIMRSNNIPVFTNEDNTIFTTVALEEYGVTTKITSNKVVIENQNIVGVTI